VINGNELVVAAHLFQDALVVNWDSEPSVYNIFDAFNSFNQDTDELVFTQSLPEFTADELLRVSKCLSAGKAGIIESKA